MPDAKAPPARYDLVRVEPASPTERRRAGARRGWATRRGALALRGNQNAAKHFAYSGLAINGAIAEKFDLLLAVGPHLDPMADGPTIALAARALVIVERTEIAIVNIQEQGEPMPEKLVSLHLTAQNNALRMLTALSLTPASRATLGLVALEGAARAQRLRQETEDDLRVRYGPKPKEEDDVDG